MPETQTEVTHEIPADDPGFNRDALETSTAAKMAEVFKDGDDQIEISETEAPAKAEEVPAVAETGTTPEVEEKPTEETETATGEQVEKEPTPAAAPATLLPAAYRRSLKAYQWTDEEIESGLKANPDAFLKTAEKVHISRVQMTQQWADLGRQAKMNQTPTATPAAETKFDAKALRAKYGNEAFIDAMEAQAAQLERSQAFIMQAQAREAERARESLNKEVDSFFGGKDLQPYADHYGKTGSTLTEQQVAARIKVLETADLLVSGARSTGRPLTLDEALTMAHDSVSSPIQARAAVKKIQQQVQTRQAATTLRPGSRAAAPRGASRKDLEGKVKDGLLKIFK